MDQRRQSTFRAMRADDDGLPRVGRSGRELGVRVEGQARDVHVDEDGMVHPRSGGMSVALHSPLNLPKPRLPRSLGGEGRDPVFGMSTAQIPESLVVRPDRHPHALVEPRLRRLLLDFESDLASTRSGWSRQHD